MYTHPQKRRSKNSAQQLKPEHIKKLDCLLLYVHTRTDLGKAHICWSMSVHQV